MKIKIANLDFALEEVTNQHSLPFPIRLLTDNEKPTLPEECISLGKLESADQVAVYMAETGVWNTIQGDPELLDDRLNLSANLIQNPKQFFEEPSMAILGSAGKSKTSSKISERRWRFRSLGEKHGIMEEI